eukprot:1179456-Prorocentrum_minimum.AAC.5
MPLALSELMQSPKSTNQCAPCVPSAAAVSRFTRQNNTCVATYAVRARCPKRVNSEKSLALLVPKDINPALTGGWSVGNVTPRWEARPGPAAIM